MAQAQVRFSAWMGWPFGPRTPPTHILSLFYLGKSMVSWWRCSQGREFWHVWFWYVTWSNNVLNVPWSATMVFMGAGHPSYNGNPNIMGFCWPLLLDWWQSHKNWANYLSLESKQIFVVFWVGESLTRFKLSWGNNTRNSCLSVL